MKRLVAVLSMFALFFAAPEFLPAQENIHSQRYTFLSTAGSIDSFGLMINPAGIGFLEATEMRIFYTSAVETDKSLTGSGGTLLLAAPLFGGINAGAGFSLLKDQGGGNYLKSSLNLSYRARKIISLGTGLRSFASNSSGSISGLFLVDAGFVSMPSDFLSIAFSVSNINRPAFFDSHVERKYRFGAAFQPFGGDFTLAADIEAGEESGDLSPSLSLRWEFLRGVGLSAGAIWKKIEERWEVFSGGLLEFKFGYFAISGGVDAGSNSALSTTFGARFSSDRTSSVTEGDNLLVSVYIPLGVTEDPRRPFPEIRGETFYDFMFKLYKVYRDPRVKGILLYFQGGKLGWAQAEEINRVIKKLAAAGKDVYAYIPSFGMKEYFAALAAKAVFVPETATLNLGGVKVTLSYISELLDKIGIKAQVFPIGKYKNFPEIFNRTSPSPETVEMLNGLLNSLADLFEAALKDRQEAMTMKELFARSPYTPSQGIAVGIIDGHCPWNKAADKVLEIVPGRFQYHHNYWDIKRRDDSFGMTQAVAVVAIEGDLVDGESAYLPFLDIKLAGSSDIVKDLNAAVSSPEVAAIVLRIDSGGGSMTAAETVFHAVKEAAARKPVVAVIGNTGASGAYYIANAANRIFLQDSTITGSIGVWGGKFSLKGLYEKIGIKRETIKIGEHSDMDSLDREYTPEEVEDIREKLKYLYDLFIKRVQEGRGLDKSAVEQAAEGIVFTGKKALELKLADQRGGLFEALEYFREEIPGLEVMKLKVYPEKGLMERLLEGFKGNGAEFLSMMDSARILIRHLSEWGGNPLVWMPFRID